MGFVKKLLIPKMKEKLLQSFDILFILCVVYELMEFYLLCHR